MTDPEQSDEREPETGKRTIYVEDRRPRFVLGLILGALLLAGGVALLADQDSSYRTVEAQAPPR